MDVHELDDRIDRLSIRKQLEILAKNLTESEQSEALAIQDKRKTPTRKPNNE